MHLNKNNDTWLRHVHEEIHCVTGVLSKVVAIDTFGNSP